MEKDVVVEEKRNVEVASCYLKGLIGSFFSLLSYVHFHNIWQCDEEGERDEDKEEEENDKVEEEEGEHLRKTPPLMSEEESSSSERREVRVETGLVRRLRLHWKFQWKRENIFNTNIKKVGWWPARPL